MVLSNLIRVEWKQLGLISNTVSKFADRAQDAGTVSFRLAAFLAHSEFNGEPVNSGKSFQFELRCP